VSFLNEWDEWEEHDEECSGCGEYDCDGDCYDDLDQETEEEQSEI
jgi:hypothetical protein